MKLKITIFSLISILFLHYAYSADKLPKADEIYLSCKALPLPEIEKILVVESVEGLKSLIYTPEQNVHEEFLHVIEWAQMDLTLPNIENFAYRLMFESEPNIWRLVQFSITGTQKTWSIPCEKFKN